MSLNQVTLEIPLNIQKGLDSGIDELFDLVYDYTIQFAKVNGFETDTISEVAEKNKVINLMDYLNFQKTIYRSDEV